MDNIQKVSNFINITSSETLGLMGINVICFHVLEKTKTYENMYVMHSSYV
jgi:hypothetical protein